MSTLVFQSASLLLTAMTVLSAAFYDCKWRRIPNFITFPAILTGLLLNGIAAGWQGFYLSVVGLTVGAGMLLVFYLLGGMGAGDVKLLGSVGAILGIDKIMTAVTLTALAGGVMAIGQIMINRWYHHLPVRFRCFVREGSSEKQFSASGDRRGAKATIPYGVAIAIGALMTLAL